MALQRALDTLATAASAASLLLNNPETRVGNNIAQTTCVGSQTEAVVSICFGSQTDSVTSTCLGSQTDVVTNACFGTIGVTNSSGAYFEAPIGDSSAALHVTNSSGAYFEASAGVGSRSEAYFEAFIGELRAAYWKQFREFRLRRHQLRRFYS
jgi:hypothetical protein